MYRSKKFVGIAHILGIVILLLTGCTPVETSSGAPLNPTAMRTEVSVAEIPASQAPAVSSTPTATATPPDLTPSLTPVPIPTHSPQAGGQTAGDPYAPTLGNTGYDVQHYTIQVQVDPAIPQIDASTRIEAVSHLENLQQLSLDFSGFDIEEVTIDGKQASYTRERGKLVIELPHNMDLGQVFTIFVDYVGSPIQTGSPFVPFVHHLGLQFIGDNLFVMSEPDGAHYWFPGNDHPTDKATFTFAITVPEDLVAIANGDLIDISESPTGKTYTWSHDDPMATYLATFAVGDYRKIETSSPAGIPIQHYVFQDIESEFLEAADITGEALDWMGEMFGTYPFDSFGFVTTRLIRSSLETQTRVLLSENMLNEETVVHEIAHMWFGDWVSMESWADMWHNEGFAVYLSLMWQTRANPGALNIYMQNLEAEVEREASPEPLGNLAPQRLFGFDSYQRGALMIHKLRLLVGEEAFFDGLQLYFERFGGGTASREAFIEVMEEASGIPLDDFFFEWLELVP